jgi:hypothetical protein
MYQHASKWTTRQFVRTGRSGRRRAGPQLVGTYAGQQSLHDGDAASGSRRSRGDGPGRRSRPDARVEARRTCDTRRSELAKGSALEVPPDLNSAAPTPFRRDGTYRHRRLNRLNQPSETPAFKRGHHARGRGSGAPGFDVLCRRSMTSRWTDVRDPRLPHLYRKTSLSPGMCIRDTSNAYSTRKAGYG